jgi:hypothetical protein
MNKKGYKEPEKKLKSYITAQNQRKINAKSAQNKR